MVSFFNSKPINSISKSFSLISKHYKFFIFSCISDLLFLLALGLIGGFVLDQLNAKAIQYALDLAKGTASTGPGLLWGVISGLVILLIYTAFQGAAWLSIENLFQRTSWKKYLKTFAKITLPLFIAFIALRLIDYAVSIKSLADKIIYSTQYPWLNAIPYLYFLLLFIGLLMYAQQSNKPDFSKWQIILSLLLITAVFWLATDFIVTQLYLISSLQIVLIQAIGLRLSDLIGLFISLLTLSLIRLYWAVNFRK